MQKRLGSHIRGVLQAQYDLQLEAIPLETPPDLRFGELATPIAFELARKLRKAPKIIAQEIVAALGTVEGFAGFEVAGAGYINARLDRAAAVRLTAGDLPSAQDYARDRGHALVEHTSINPNKAAHIGHLRNAVLGDTFARLLRHAGRRVEVQNYIDNTGVQVADVVLGFLHLEPKTPGEIRALAAEPKFDYLCWDLYTRVTQWLAGDPTRLTLRAQVLKDIEEDHGSAAMMAEVVSTAIVRCHLVTLDRLGISFDLLLRESEILRLKFWDAAFALLKQHGAIQLVSS
ncbi:MAG: arginine--tRNA ligase, partial [Acidobacteriota bacterium]|nr:arginine--tRNA ligase [Acidobacteriota bacterium]